MSREPLFSLKKPADWFWRPNVSRQQVLAQLEQAKIGGDWLICPQGEAHRSITVERFVTDPHAFESEPSPAPQRHADPPRSNEELVASRSYLLLFCLAWFNLFAVGAVGVMSPVIAVVLVAVIYAQIGLVATWGVFSPAHFTRRLAISGAVGLGLFVCLMLGATGSAGASAADGRVFVAFLLVCPIFLFAVQAPLWAARVWLGCEIARADEPAIGSYRRPTGIIDLIIGTAAVGTALAGAKLGPGLITTTIASQEAMVYFVSAAGIAGAASLVSVTPLVFITLGPRHRTGVVSGLVGWHLLIIPALYVLCLVTSNTINILYACFWAPVAFSTVLCTGFFIVRCGGYRLLRRGRP